MCALDLLPYSQAGGHMMATALSGSRVEAKAPLRPSWWLLTVAQQLQEATIALCAMAGLTFCNNPGCSNPS
jgi:hypothetical protein